MTRSPRPGSKTEDDRTSHVFTIGSASPDRGRFLEVDTTNHTLHHHGREDGLGGIGADHIHLSSEAGDTLRVMPIGGGGAKCELDEFGEDASIVLQTISATDPLVVGEEGSGEIQIFQGSERRLWLTSLDDSGLVELGASGRARYLRADDR